MLNIEVDMQNPAHIQAAAAFFNSLAGLTPSESLAIVAAEPAKLAKLVKAVTDKPVTDKPVTDEPVTDKPVAEKPVTEKPVTDKKTGDKEITREDLILLVSELSSNADNKNAMRAELDKLGAKNTRSLTTDQYKPFYDFLTKLKAGDDLPY